MTIVKFVKIPKPEDFSLAGTPMQVGSQLAEAVLRPALQATLAAMPKEHHENLLAGVLAEVSAAMGMTIGQARAVALLQQFAGMVQRMPPDIAGQLPPDPEVH